MPLFSFCEEKTHTHTYSDLFSLSNFLRHCLHGFSFSQHEFITWRLYKNSLLKINRIKIGASKAYEHQTKSNNIIINILSGFQVAHKCKRIEFSICYDLKIRARHERVERERWQKKRTARRARVLL